MRVFLILFRKEFKSYFLTPFGWVVLGLVLLMQGLSMTTAMEKMKDAPLSENFLLVSFNSPNFWFYFLFIFPLLTMRLFAEEQRSGTLETLMTAPVTSAQVVFSKYIAALYFLRTCFGCPFCYSFKIFTVITGNPPPYEIGHLIGSYAILLLIGSFLLAIGCFASTLSSNQIVAGIITYRHPRYSLFSGFCPLLHRRGLPSRFLVSLRCHPGTSSTICTWSYRYAPRHLLPEHGRLLSFS